ncbi:hypothetical protein F5Y17DRAFT_438454 [Xylariaceae sp. FL0594]|nr:hypothetical protein F5Y17DRAFT_438454 [Xylariaceae sp. FL0594]
MKKLVYGDEASTSFGGKTRRFLNSAGGLAYIVVDGWQLCSLNGPCPDCDASPEVISLHWECLQVFQSCCVLQGDDALSRLWVAAAWKTPWRKAVPRFLPSEAVASASLVQLCKISALPPFHTLPQEMVEMIHSYCEDALLWKAAVAYDLATNISATAPVPLTTAPLSNVVSWERGGPPQTVSQPPESWSQSRLRITVDWVGIKKIEHTSDQDYKRECSPRYAYVVLDEKDLGLYNAHFKDGYARLELLSDATPDVWNTPTPPERLLIRAYKPSRYPNQHLFAAELADLSGITFFFAADTGSFYHIYVHRPGATCADLTWLKCYDLPWLTWCYLPMPRSDRVIALSLRHAVPKNLSLGELCGRYAEWKRFLSVMVKMEKAGDVIIGSPIQEQGHVGDYLLCWHPPVTLVYSQVTLEPIIFLGAYCRSGPPAEPVDWPAHEPKTCPIKDEVMLFSTASLEDLRSVEVFYGADHGGRYCSGMLLYYKNGACRAVGQCRIGIDSTRKFDKPSRFCFRMEVFGSLVDWGNESHSEVSGWSCNPLKGRIECWFSHSSSVISVHNGLGLPLPCGSNTKQ